MTGATPKLQWGVVARDLEMGAAMAALDAQRAVMMVGPAGIGKTVLSRAVAAARGGGRRELFGSPGLRSVSFGALLPVLAVSVVAAALAFRGYRRAAGRPVPGEIALVAALVRAIKRRGVIAADESAVPARSVLEELEALAAESEHGYDAGAMHERLAGLAAGYVEGTLGMRRRERTTAELVRVAGARLGRRRATELERVLGACDLVKFARARPDAAEFRALASALSAFIRAQDARP